MAPMLTRVLLTPFADPEVGVAVLDELDAVDVEVVELAELPPEEHPAATATTPRVARHHADSRR
jgi:hypothetical protein